MASNNRPLSPHIQIYKPQLTTFMSITHRATGIVLAVGTVMLVCWLIAAATGENAFNNVQTFLGSIIGKLLLLGWSYALFYHMCNGLRHLFWDAGRGFEIETAYTTGRLVIGASILLTIGAWLWGYDAMAAI
jgi:succinate dehydrogenase / fumarate reductase cytochrome b subunit